jgi:hypothetical protein
MPERDYIAPEIVMKKLGILLATALTLSTGSVRVQAHGCGGCDWWPFAAFGLGLGIGSAVTYATTPRYPAYSYTYVYPPPSVPAYAPPSAPQAAPTSVYARHPVSLPAIAHAPQHAIYAPQVAACWVPSTPGAGRWVPDPNPYRYAPVIAPSGFPSEPTAVATAAASANRIQQAGGNR